VRTGDISDSGFIVEKEKLSSMIGFRVAPSVRDRLEAQAKKEDRQFNWMARKCLEEGLVAREKKHKK
jgi:predicted transcriptional regulator